jgi:hypothetical protein
VHVALSSFACVNLTVMKSIGKVGLQFKLGSMAYVPLHMNWWPKFFVTVLPFFIY